MRVRVKMCGFTRAVDVQAAVQAGVDAIGFVFYPKSKRYINPAHAAKLNRLIPAFVDSVALFVNASPSFVKQVIQEVQPTLLQFHGDETVAYCESFGYPYVRAFRVGSPQLDTPEKVWRQCQLYASAKGWLFDSFSPLYGGSGLRFDPQLLELVQKYRTRSDPVVIIAGGIGATNLAKLIKDQQPFAIDVSSAIEDGPGIKNAVKMQEFIKALNYG